MKRSVMFVQSIWVLLMAIHMTTACPCNSMGLWEQAMCPQMGRTVVEGTVIDVKLMYPPGPNNDESLANAGTYRMTLVQLFKNGTYPLRVADGTFDLLFPLTSKVCGTRLNKREKFIIAGDVYPGGTLHSSLCYLILDSEQTHNDQDKMDILLGNTKLNCAGIAV